MPVFTDQMGHQITLKQVPQRIVSLVPSQTELLFDLGLDKEVLGITKFCVHPKHWLKEKVLVGGTKTVNFSKIQQLNPDLIIGNKEENSKVDIERLKQEYPVWMSDIHNLTEALHMISDIADITNTKAKAELLSRKIMQEFDELKPNIKKPVRIAYFIWNKPMMVAGSNTFISHMIEKMGGINVFSGTNNVRFKDNRYPQITIEDIKEAKPQQIWLSSEPFPFKQKHLNYFKTNFPDVVIKIVDGELFSWYGSRLVLAPSYFKQLMA